jgi:hypothetical protein
MFLIQLTETTRTAERSHHTGEVVGSIPTAPTTKSPVKSSLLAISQWNIATSRDGTVCEHNGSIRGLSGVFVHAISQGSKS